MAPSPHMVPLHHGLSPVVQTESLQDKNVYWVHWALLFISSKENICLNFQSKEFASSPKDHTQKSPRILNLLLIENHCHFRLTPILFGE